MLIKQHDLASYLTQHALPTLYILIGQEHFLLSLAVRDIKKRWLTQQPDSEETILHIQNASDWVHVEEKAYSYSLFSASTWIDVRYEKQTFDTAAKTFLTRYMDSPASSCLLVIRAPNLPLKQLTVFSKRENVHIVQFYPLNAVSMQQWIKKQFQNKGIHYDPTVPLLIQQHTQGNMLACAQVLEKIELIDDGSMLTADTIKTQLMDQCDYQLFELSDACLLRDSHKVILHLRHAHQSGVEPSLILWLLSQDIRYLIQLIELTVQGVPLTTACSQLKIMAFRSKLYQAAIKRMNSQHLLQLLRFCQKIDANIKTNGIQPVWHALEDVALSLCLGSEVGYFA